MKPTKLRLLLGLRGIVVVATNALAADLIATDPRALSWFTTESTRYACVRETNASAAVGAATWTGQTLPAYAGVQEVASDANYFYVRSHGVAGLGAVGLYVNGVSLFDNRDAFCWNGTTEGNGNGSWNREAYVNEGVTFDKGVAHQELTGNYHYHAHPPTLRFQLGDNISYNAGTGIYSEDTGSLHHSPILACVSDGLSIYKPYGYSNRTNASSGIRRMVSGFVIRNGQTGTDNVTTGGRGTIPAWAQRDYNVGPTGGGGGGSVAPGGSASRGTTTTVTITLPTAPPQPPADRVPTCVTPAGTIAGTSILRPSAGTVLATFAIPASAPTDPQNIVVTCNLAPTYTMTGAFTIN